MNHIYIYPIFIVPLIVIFGVFSFVGDIQADTSGTVTMTVKISVCGNGVLEGGEQCDGSNVGDKTCSYLGYSSGTLGCTSSCEFDTSSCNSSAENNVTTTFSVFTGGSQTLSDSKNSVAIELPANFYSDNLRLDIFSHLSNTISSSKSAPSGKQFVGKVYDLNFTDPNGNSVETLFKPTTVTIHYDESDIGNLNENEIKPYKFEDDGSSWQIIPDSILDAGKNTITFSTQSFCWLGLFSSTPTTETTENNTSLSSNRRNSSNFIYIKNKENDNYTDIWPNLIFLKKEKNSSDSNTEQEIINKKDKSDHNEKSLEKNGSGKESDNSTSTNENTADKNNKLKIITKLLIVISMILIRFVRFI